MKFILNNNKIILNNSKIIQYPYNKINTADVLNPYSSHYSMLHDNKYALYGECKNKEVLTKNGYYAVSVTFGTKSKIYTLENKAISFNNCLILNLDYNNDFIDELVEIYYKNSQDKFIVELLNKNNDFNISVNVNFISRSKPTSIYRYLSGKSPANGIPKSFKYIPLIYFDSGDSYSEDMLTNIFDTCFDKIRFYVKEYPEIDMEFTSYQKLDFTGLPDDIFNNTNTITLIAEIYYKNKIGEYKLIDTFENKITLYNF